MLLSLTGVGKSYGAERILEQVNLTVEDRSRIALIGPNGAGKTTLLNLITGALENDEGEITRQEGLRIGYLRQNGGLSGDGTIESEMAAALGNVFALEKQLLETGERMAALSDHESEAYLALAAQYQRLNEEYDSCDGYGAQVRINTILTGMGFASFDRKTPVESLSGGERTRLMLCKLLVEEPGLLILDEATNHLDFKMLGWLEDYLLSYRGAILTVSHDRFFLDNVTTTTWELENKTIVSYPAPYSKYLTLRAERLARMEKEYERYQQEVARLQEYVDRNLVRASTSQSAKSRLKMIEHLDIPPEPVRPAAPPAFFFAAKIRPVSDVLITEDLCVSVGEWETKRILVDSLSLTVKRGERIAIIGENGAGKSTLLRTLMGKRPADRGEIIWGRNTHPAFYEQDSSDLHSDKTALMELWDRFPRASEHQLRTLLGSLGLRGEDAFKKVGVLSGGERARVKFAILTLQDGNVLLLDEPTNHLDIPAKESLEAALRQYEGTLIIVSHDRWLLSHVPTRILLLKNGLVESFDGNYAAVRELLEERTRPAAASSPVPKASGAGAAQFHKSRAQRAAAAAQKRRQAEVEALIAKTEQAIEEAQRSLADPALASDYEALAAVSQELDSLQETLAALYEEWDSFLS